MFAARAARRVAEAQATIELHLVAGAASESVGQPEIQLAPEKSAAPPRVDMTVAEMRQWLREWIAGATGQPADVINDATPMVELGLSSRDAVAMASDIEDLTGVTLTATVAFRHPTIESTCPTMTPTGHAKLMRTSRT